MAHRSKPAPSTAAAPSPQAPRSSRRPEVSPVADLAVAPRSRARAYGRAAPFVVALALVAAACGGNTASTPQNNAAPVTTAPPLNKVGGKTSGPPDAAPTPGGKVVYGIEAEPEGLDPVRYAFSQAGHIIASAVYDPLATLDENGQAVPYLATGFEASSDNKTWTIGLPTGVKFHDGTALDADAVAKVLSAYKTSAIDGAALYMVDSFEVKDPTHVTVKLNRPMASLPSIFTTQAGYIIAPAMLTNGELGKKPIGSGPFIFQTHEDGKIWSFKKNPDYRQPGLPALDAIDFLPIVDPVGRNDMLVKGDLDVMQTQGGPQILDLRSSPFKTAENQYGDKGFLMVNTTKAPFDNVVARRAVAYATNAAKWRKDNFADVASPANSPFGPGQPGFTAENAYPKYSLDEAKKLVKQYETEAGKPLEFSLLVAEDNTNVAVGQEFQAGYTEAGMKVTLEQKPQINLLASVAVGQYQLSQFRVFASPNPDADTHFYRTSSITPSISLNFPRYTNPDVDRAVDEAIATTDDGKRKVAYEKVNKILADQVPFMWLGQEVWMVAANQKVNGIYAAANGSIATVGPKTWVAKLSITR